MGISAISPIQSQFSVQQIEPVRRQEKPSFTNRNTGPDTVTLSSEALNLSRMARSENAAKTASDEAVDAAETLPEWFTDMLPASVRNSAAGMPGLREILNGSGFGSLGLSEDEQSYCEALGEKLSEVLNAHGITSTNQYKASVAGNSAFGKIFQQELLKALSSDARFTGING